MPNGTLRLATLRSMTRKAARNAGDQTYYETSMVDFAIQRAANDLIRECRLCLRVDPTGTLAGTADYAALPTGFRCDRLESVFLTGSNVVVDAGGSCVNEALYIRGGTFGYGGGTRRARLVVCDYVELLEYATGTPRDGQPELVAFQSDEEFTLYPTPDAVYTVNLRWSDQFTTFAPGVPLASFTLSTDGGTITAAGVIDGSDNLGTTGTVTITSTGSGSGGTLTGTLTNGSLSGIGVGAGGAGYTTDDYLAFTGTGFGADRADNRVTNLADEYVRDVVMLGAPAYLCMNDPEKTLARKMYDDWGAHLKRMKGKLGGLGAQRILRGR